MRFIYVLTLFSAFLASSFSLADNSGWKAISLKAADGTSIQLTYRGFCTRQPDGTEGNGGFSQILGCFIPTLRFEVENKSFRGNEKIRVVFLPQAGRNDYFYTTDLAYYGYGYFAHKLEETISVSGYVYRPRVPAAGDRPEEKERMLAALPQLGDRQEIAIVVDGNWLKDPISGQSNFSFSLK